MGACLGRLKKTEHSWAPACAGVTKRGAGVDEGRESLRAPPKGRGNPYGGAECLALDRHAAFGRS
jgi:hypothetical protein